MEVIYVTHNLSKGDTFISVKISFVAYWIYVWVTRFRVINFDLRCKYTFQHFFFSFLFVLFAIWTSNFTMISNNKDPMVKCIIEDMELKIGTNLYL